MGSNLERCVVKIFDSRAGVASGAGKIVGTGVLVAPDLVLTCAHVVEAALGHRTHLDEQQAKGLRVRLELGSLADVPELTPAIGTVHTWYEVLAGDAGQGPDDICLLRLPRSAPFELLPPADLWGTYKKRVAACAYGFGRTADGKEQHLWLDCVCKGRSGRYHQVDIDDPKNAEAVAGYSGGPVLDVDTGKLLGILVTAHVGQKAAGMIHADILRRIVEESVGARAEDNPIEVFSWFLDRLEQTTQVVHSKSKLHCFLVECRRDDLPVCFAHRLSTQLYYENNRLHGGSRSVSADRLKAVAFDVGSNRSGEPSTSFRAGLEAKLLGDPIEEWLNGSSAPRVVFVNVVSGGMDICKQALWVLQGFAGIDHQASQIRGRLIVILPWYAKPNENNMLLVRWWLQRLQKKLAALDPALLTLLPRLGAIERHHLAEYLDHVPPPVLDRFSTKFKTDGLGMHLSGCLQPAESKPYLDVAQRVKLELNDPRLHRSPENLNSW